ncbi:MAG: hypothetical protein MHPSP_002848 [Paramarteilia canceri]
MIESNSIPSSLGYIERFLKNPKALLDIFTSPLEKFQKNQIQSLALIKLALPIVQMVEESCADSLQKAKKISQNSTEVSEEHNEVDNSLPNQENSPSNNPTIDESNDNNGFESEVQQIVDTGIVGPEVARRFLFMTNGNVDEAMNMILSSLDS